MAMTMMRRGTEQASARRIGQDISALFRPPRRMAVAEAVKRYLRVPVGASSSLPWEAELTPYMLEPMNCLSLREFDAVIFAGPSRTGKTLGLLDGWIVYGIVCDPGDMLVVQMTEGKAREHSKTRLARIFHHSLAVRRRLSPIRNDNNVHDKIFSDGTFLKIGWPSINIFSSSDYKRVALTDYDRYPENIDGEGDSFALASKRTTTFMSAGMTLVESSPGREVINPKWRRTTPHEAPPTTGILALYNRGDRRRWYWPCPHCGEYFQPAIENMTGYREQADLMQASEAAHLQCPSCAGVILAEQKRLLNNRGVWLRDGERIDSHGQRSGTPRRSRIASFWLEGPAAAYQSWPQLVNKLLSAEQEYETTGSEETLRTVINTDWGLPYQSRLAQGSQNSESLMARAEAWTKRTIPPGVRFLVAAVDVQGGKNARFVVQVVGYGSQGERWIIDRYNIRHSARADGQGESLPVNPAANPEDWQLLRSDVLEKSYPLDSEGMRRLPILAMAVDSGGEDGVTDNAYAFWRACRRDGVGGQVYLFKGDGLARTKLISKTYPDNTERSDRRARARGEVPLYLLQTNQLKDRIASALARETPGPNYVHFPDWLGAWFYEELTYEERGADGKWRKPGKGANEAFDLLCYAHALALLRGYERINWASPPRWARLPQNAPETLTPTPHPASAITSPRQNPIPWGGQSGGGWL